jgi:hypothetical protein
MDDQYTTPNPPEPPSPPDPDSPDQDPDQEPDSPEFIQAALLLERIWEAYPHTRPNPAPGEPPPADPKQKQKDPNEQKEDFTMLPAEERHRRKCLICRHPDREEIEEEFVNWHDVWYLAKHYNISDHRSIYRHARATGLIVRRRENMRQVLDSIIERRPDRVTADSVIRAIRAYSCLTDDNRWVEPSSRVEFAVTKPAPQSQKAPPSNGANGPLRDAEGGNLIPPLGLETNVSD